MSSSVNSGLECIQLPMMYCLFSQVVGELCSIVREMSSEITLQANIIENAVNVGQIDQSEATQLGIQSIVQVECYSPLLMYYSVPGMQSRWTPPRTQWGSA
jgi:hypothetical protein